MVGTCLLHPATHCLEQGVDPVECVPFLISWAFQQRTQLRHETAEQFLDVLQQLIGGGHGQGGRGVEDVPVGDEARDKRAALEAEQHEGAGRALREGRRA